MFRLLKNVFIKLIAKIASESHIKMEAVGVCNCQTRISEKEYP